MKLQAVQSWKKQGFRPTLTVQLISMYIIHHSLVHPKTKNESSTFSCYCRAVYWKDGLCIVDMLAGQILPVLSSLSLWNDDRTRLVGWWVLTMLVAKIISNIFNNVWGEKKERSHLEKSWRSHRCRCQGTGDLAFGDLMKVICITKTLIGSCWDDVSLTKRQNRGLSTQIAFIRQTMLNCLRMIQWIHWPMKMGQYFDRQHYHLFQSVVDAALISSTFDDS